MLQMNKRQECLSSTKAFSENCWDTEGLVAILHWNRAWKKQSLMLCQENYTKPTYWMVWRRDQKHHSQAHIRSKILMWNIWWNNRCVTFFPINALCVLRVSCPIDMDPYSLPHKYGSMSIGHSVKTSFRTSYEESPFFIFVLCQTHCL